MPEESRLDAKRRHQEEARAQLAQEVDLDDLDDVHHLAKIEIDHCGMCDDDGYSGNRVCDHREHSTAAGRAAAMAMFRESRKNAS